MKTILFVAACLAVTTALPVILLEDKEGKKYILLPIARQKRDLTLGANQNGFSVGPRGTMWSNKNPQVDGVYGAFKSWQSLGLKPDTFGGRVDYSHNPSESPRFVGDSRTSGYGTDVNAGVKYNIAQGKYWNADVTGQYGRHFEGPGGTGKGEAGAFLNVEEQF